MVRRAAVVLTAGCHCSRSEGRQQDRGKTGTAKEGSKGVGGEGGQRGPEGEKMKEKMYRGTEGG